MSPFELGILGFTVLMLVGCMAVMFRLHSSWKGIYENEAQRLEELEQCRREIEALASSNLGLGRKVERMSRDMNWLREQIDLVGQSKSEQISYDQVARLAEQGTDVDGLISVFGISEAEAELVMKLNPDGKKSPANENNEELVTSQH